jgi:hypothetical protein
MHDRPNGVISRGGIWMLDEKGLQEIDQLRIRLSNLGLINGKGNVTMKKLLTEVRRLNELYDMPIVKTLQDNQRYKQALEEIVNQHDKPHSDRWTLADIATKSLKGEE